jgi:peptidoglycan/xylan/chitin deacetylase (PgdA/CDA1 family)
MTVRKPVTEYRQLQSKLGLKKRIRELIRDTAIFALFLRDSDPSKGDWIRFPYYHHVFDDECASFDKQLIYMNNIGDFVSLDDAVTLLESNQPLRGRYFCITFDDGFKNCLTNAIPIIKKNKAHATFFLPTIFIGYSPDNYPDGGNTIFLDGNMRDFQMVEFLTWKDCAEILNEGMSVGSHTVRHKTLSSLPEDEVEKELFSSKRIIEEKLGIHCVHFCAPVGIPGRDFIIDRDPQIAKQIGFRSFMTTKRGSVNRKSDPMLIERDHTIAIWDIYQLRYFFSR